MTFRLAANFPMFHGQISHVFDPRRQFVALATSLYVRRNNLFHVGAENPFRSLLVAANDLLVKGSSGKRTGTALLSARRRSLQFARIRTGNQKIIADVNQQWLAGRGCNCPWVMHHL